MMECFEAAKGKHGMRVTEYCILSNHIHLIVEVDDTQALSAGMKALNTRIARCLNRVWGRRGKVFKERFHARVLKSLRQVRNVLLYVLNNGRKHGVQIARGRVDPFSSGLWFRGWRDCSPLERPDNDPTVPPRTWLLTTGWKRYGLLSVNAVPGSAK